MGYAGSDSGRQVSGAAGLARYRRELARREAVRRALAARRAVGGEPEGRTHAAPSYVAAPAAPALVARPHAYLDPAVQAPGHAAEVRAGPEPVAAVAPQQAQRNWWEEEPGKRTLGVPKHGKSMIAGALDGFVSLFIFAIAPAALMSRAASSYGLDLSQQIMGSVLVGAAIAAFAFMRWMFMRGTVQRLTLSLGQVLGVVAWILVAISPNIDLDYKNVQIQIGLLRYLLLAAGSYALMTLYFVGEHFVYRPMYEDIRRAKLAV